MNRPEKANVYKLPNGTWAAHCLECGTVGEYQTWALALHAANLTAAVHRGGPARMRVVLYLARLNANNQPRF